MRNALVVMVVLAALIAVVPSLAQASQRYELLPVRVIELDGEQMKISGNAGGWLQEHFGPLVRQACSDRNDIVIAVSGRQFNEVADTQDRVATSGRYRESSRQLLRKGQMVGPSEHFSISLFATTEYRRDGGEIISFLSRGAVNADIERVKARVEIVLEPINIGSGLHSRGFRVSGLAEDTIRLNVSLSGRQAIDYDRSSSSPEDRIVARAAEKAINELIDRLAGESHRGERLRSITVTSERDVRQGDTIVFYRGGKKIAVYEVVSVDDDRLGVRILNERSRPKDGDQFKIL